MQVRGHCWVPDHIMEYVHMGVCRGGGGGGGVNEYNDLPPPPPPMVLTYREGERSKGEAINNKNFRNICRGKV